jgi:hypothetical protein
MFRNKILFYGEELLAPRQTSKENHALSAVATAYSIYFSYPPYWRPYLLLQPEDAPCCGDMYSLITEEIKSRLKSGNAY